MSGIHTKALASLSAAALRVQPDDRLVALLRDGHERAFEEIVRRYRSALVRFATGIVAPDRAEDVVQEALIRAHGALLGNDAEIALRPWLYRIVHNGAVSALRGVRSHEQLDENFDGVPQPPDIVQRREDLRDLVTGINALPEAQREAIVRSELIGSSQEEIASALGTSTGGVGQLVFRARATLRGGVAVVLPLPVLRLLLRAGESPAGAFATAGLATDGSGGVAGKLVVVAIVALVAGSTPALRDADRGSSNGSASASEGQRGSGGSDSRHDATLVASTAGATAPVGSADARSRLSGEPTSSGDEPAANGDGPPSTDGGGDGGGSDSAPPPSGSPPPTPPSNAPPQGPGVHTSSTDCPPGGGGGGAPPSSPPPAPSGTTDPGAPPSGGSYTGSTPPPGGGPGGHPH